MINVTGNIYVSTFKWEIDNFSKICQDFGINFKSPEFRIDYPGNSVCHLKLYPKGVNEKYKDYLSLYLVAEPKVRTNCNFTIVNNKGYKVVNKTLKDEVFGNQGFGFHEFESYNFIVNPKNKILSDDKLTIVCQIGGNEMLRKFHHLDYVQEEYEALLNDDKFSDVSLISEGKAIKAHKCILAKRSSVFSAMFNADMKENQDNTVEIVDIKYDVLFEMLRFIYSGFVNKMDKLADQLAVAADKYNLNELKGECEKTMIRKLGLENVVNFLRLADSLWMNDLKENATEFIVENMADVAEKPEFDLLSAELLREICRCFGNSSRG